LSEINQKKRFVNAKKIEVLKRSIGQVVFVIPFFSHGGFLDLILVTA
jgi:hypothetical protein